MAKKYSQTPREQFVQLFKAVLEQRVDPETTHVDDAKSYLHLLGTGSHAIVGADLPAPFRVDIGPDEAGNTRPTIQLTAQGVTIFRKLIDLFGATEGIGDLIACEYLQETVLRELQALGTSPPADDSAWEDRVKAFVKSLRHLVGVHRVYLPLVNLAVEADVTFGNVSLLRRDTVVLELVELIDKGLENKTNPPEEMAQIKAGIEGLLRMYAAAPCCASPVSGATKARPKRSLTTPSESSSTSFVVTFPCCTGPSRRNASVCTMTTRGSWCLLSSPRKKGDSRCLRGFEGYNLPFELCGRMLDFLRQHGSFDYLCTILCKGRNQRTELEKALATAIWWIGSGNHRPSPAERIVAIATGLEAMLIPEQSDQIAEDVAYRASFLLGITSDERQQIPERMKELYSLRSAIVHAGQVEVPGEYLADLNYYALAILVEMANGAEAGWTKIEELIEAIKPVKFGIDAFRGTPRPIPRGPFRLTVRGRISTGNAPLVFRMQY